MDFQSLPDLLREVGYAATASVADCQKILQVCSSIDAPTIARSLFIMGRTFQGLTTDTALVSEILGRQVNQAELPTTWRADVLAQAIQNLDASLNWYDVVQSLDFPGFVVKDVNGLKVIVDAVKTGLEFTGNNQFPVDRLLQRWNNREGQFSILRISLRNPEVIPFGESECQQVHINVLKTPPDEADRQVANWRSINLMEALLNLGEDASVREGVKDLITLGMSHCPDVIVLALAQAQTQWTSLRKEMLDKLIYRYFQPNANSMPVLVYIWNNCGQMPQVRQLLMSALKTYYKADTTDQVRLNRIMEIAHEIKALKNLIKINTEDDFAFGFELAVVASRRNFVNLKMWFEENINNRVFLDELVKYNTQAKRISLSNDVQKLIDDTLRPLQQPVPPPQQQQQQPQPTAMPGMMSPSMTSTQEDLLQRNFQSMNISPNPVSLPSQLGDLSNYKPQQSTGTFDYPGGQIYQQQSTTSPIVSGGTVPGLPSFDAISTSASNQPNLSFLNQPNLPAGGVPRSLAGQLQHQAQAPPHPQGFMFSDQPRTQAAFQQDGSSKAHIDSLFKELYEHKTVTPDEFVEQLKRMKHQNKDLDDYMEPLWKEFKYLSTYPSEQLKTTAFVWGKILGDELLDDSQYCSKFLNRIIEALEIGMRSNGNEKMVIFGETVLQQFILQNKHKRILSKKKIYMQFCERIVTSSWFRQGGEKRLQPPMLVALIKECVKEQRSIIPTPDPSAIRTRPDITEPPEEIQDRIGFIYNNLSNNNLKQKSAEMRQALESNPDYFLWLANYIVVKRVLKEENFLQTYADVVEELTAKLSESGKLKSPFNEMVKDELISAIKQLLQKDKQSTDMESRKMLKHFGAFLGLITIARDKPVLADDIDFRFLLLEAYQKGHVELQFVVPFVVKVIEATKKSRLFQLKLPVADPQDDHLHQKKRASGNAWTLGVMNTLMELYKTHDATLNLKFEVEILCKEHLKLELDQFEAAEPFLTNDEAKRNIISQLSLPKQQQQQSPVDEQQAPPMQRGIGAAPQGNPDLIYFYPGLTDRSLIPRYDQ